ncbi:MAG: hypothetical protein ACXAC5_02710 [Promethearchaeota archaeon]|jgi:hypothetical protein
MWAELFIVGTFWFWALIICEGLWLFGVSKHERGWASAVSLVLTALLLCFFGDVNIFAWIWQHPLMTVYYFIGYLVIGAAWSVVKWRLLCGDIRDKYLEVRKDFFADRNLTSGKPIPPEHQKDWIDRIRRTEWSDYFSRWSRNSDQIKSIKDIIPKAKDYKPHILFWMGYWPLSLFWFFLSDLLERLFDKIYRLMTSLFQMIANATFAGIPDDIEQSATDVDKKNYRDEDRRSH